jgi:hypothetical protein
MQSETLRAIENQDQVLVIYTVEAERGQRRRHSFSEAGLLAWTNGPAMYWSQ